MFPETRPQRGRRTEGLRELARETTLTKASLILPLFVVPGRARASQRRSASQSSNRREAVVSMPGVDRISVDLLDKRVNSLASRAVLLFGVPDDADKDEDGAVAFDENGVVPSAIRAIKKSRPDLVVITDVCLCAYTRHGHCGVLTAADLPARRRAGLLPSRSRGSSKGGEIDIDATLDALARMATAHAEAGADMVAPSAMTDGQVKAIRARLDRHGFQNTAIMSYAAKFASSFYGPFREAAHSAPTFGDRRAYQLPAANRREAIRDALLDEAEGADWLMVKPAMPYLDVLFELRSATRLPIAAYQVSGEYAMLKAAVAAGALDEKQAVMESALCIKRAGADAIITYYAEEICGWLEER